MLTFIVLGIVPGTSIQLSFSDMLALCACLLLIIGTAVYFRRKIVRRTIRQLSLSLISL
jgi:hypothetical protein